jgi:hypothetical protein
MLRCSVIWGHVLALALYSHIFPYDTRKKRPRKSFKINDLYDFFWSNFGLSRTIVRVISVFCVCRGEIGGGIVDLA